MKKFILIVLFLASIFFLSKFYSLKKNYQVIFAEFNNKNYYPEDCFINFEGKKYLATNRFIYNWNILIKNIVPAGEGILVHQIDILNYDYTCENNGRKFLNLKEIENEVRYNGKKYIIDYKNGDSLISKLNNHKIIIFINSENTD